MKPVFRASAVCESHQGLVRSYNEDACLVNDQDLYYLVADGMGGAAAGELASGLFKETAVELFSSTPRFQISRESLHELILECFHTAHARILSHVEGEPSHAGMGCTAELLAFHEGDLVIGHVGDSRTYRFRDRKLEQLTTDHSFVQEQEDLGLITREQAENHAMRNLILRVVGSSQELEVDLIASEVLPGDIFLLCTDGLCEAVPDEQIAATLAYDLDLPIRATMLIDQANVSGGADNVTVVLIEIVSP